ncbi:MAG: DUF4489 domain-containing protein [Clostridia bacterium]|nr:DUF4489 domain-containing protein [Clostridia bacterium]
MTTAYMKSRDCQCKKKCPTKKLEKDIRLACGTRGGEVDLLNRTGDTINLVSVGIELGDLITPLVKVDFATTVEFEVTTSSPGSADTPDLELQFILSRVCEDGIVQELETYTFIRDFNIVAAGSTLVARTTDPIGFTFCDCVTSCKTGCCTYSVQVFVSNVDVVPVSIATIDDSFINAIAQGVKIC